MKKRVSLLVIIGLVVMGCHNSHSNISIAFKDSRHSYSMKATFHESRTRQVERYMNRCIGKESNVSFMNTSIDGQITLDDRTHIYMNKRAGYLLIKLDKDENSEESYERVRDMCQGIKNLLAK